MTIRKSRLIIGSALAGCAMYTLATPGFAQEAKSGNDAAASDAISGDIVVTARKRDERLIDVPVAVSALSDAAIQRYATSTLAAIAQQTPQLVIGEATTQTGGTINLRGVGAGQSNPATDSPVSVNVDGVQVSQGNVLRLGQYDIQRVEVLKGPQTLFFGKNSPAGVISLVSKDPGPSFEAQIRGGYEFAADQRFAEAIVSGPLGGGFGARLVGYISKQDGWYRNIAVPTPGLIFATNPPNGPAQTEKFARLTLTYASPDDSFNARLKLSHGHVDRKNGTTVNAQRVACVGTRPALSVTVTDCAPNRFYATSALSPAMVATDPANFGDGNPYFDSKQTLGSLELNYNPSDSFTLTSVTGYYRGHEDFLDSFTQTELPLLASRSNLVNRQWTQEVRLASDFDGPMNFLVGGFYQDAHLTDAIPLVFGAGVLAPVPVRVPIRNFAVDTQAYSLFGQLRYDVTDRLELAGGARYSHERKELGGTVGGAAVVVQRPKRTFNDISPEVTLTYKPDTNTTLYASYREGFVSGGYNITALQPVGATVDPSFEQSTVRGGEIGAKGYLAGRQIRFDLTAYYYRYLGLQLSAFDPATLALTTRNAASAKVRGIEANAFIRPDAVEGLELQAGVAYNKANYGTYLGACYGGQSIAAGCNLNPGANGAFNSQNLSGKPLVRAPKWSVMTGFSYDQPINSGLSAAISMHGTYTSSYFAQLEADPRAIQNGYWTLNGSISLHDAKDGWLLALIGTNLTQSYAVSSSFAGPLTGSGTGTANATLSDVNGTLVQPRAVMLQLTVRSSLFE